MKRFLAFFGAHYGVLLCVCLMMVVIFGCRDTAKMYQDLSEKHWSYLIIRDQALTVEKIILKRLVEIPPDTSVIGSRLRQQKCLTRELALAASMYNTAASQIDSSMVKSWDLPVKVALTTHKSPTGPSTAVLRTFATVK